MNNDLSHRKEHATFKAYALGFLFSVFLTFLAYFLVDKQLLSREYLLIAVLSLAFIQALIQLVFFLHLGEEKKPRLNLMVFLFMLLVLVVIIGGSLWVMTNLNYRMM